MLSYDILDISAQSVRAYRGISLHNLSFVCLFQLVNILRAVPAMNASTMSSSITAMWNSLVAQLLSLSKPLRTAPLAEALSRVPSASTTTRHLALTALTQAALIRNDATDMLRAAHVLLSPDLNDAVFDVCTAACVRSMPPFHV